MTERQIQLSIVRAAGADLLCACPNYTPSGWFECDVWAVNRLGYAHEFEIKLSRRDFLADFGKATVRNVRDEQGRHLGIEPVRKHTALAAGDQRAPARFSFVVPGELAELHHETEMLSSVPAWAGFAVVDGKYGNLRVLKDAPRLHDRKVGKGEIRTAQRRMWYRYWEALRTIERMRSDREHELKQTNVVG